MKDLQRPSLTNIVATYIMLVEALIGVLTLSAYIPSWSLKWYGYRFAREYNKKQKGGA
jgi:hypothetical protein